MFVPRVALQQLQCWKVLNFYLWIRTQEQKWIRPDPDPHHYLIEIFLLEFLNTVCQSSLVLFSESTHYKENGTDFLDLQYTHA